VIKALLQKLSRASKTALVFPIRMYQKYISPQLPRRCNYYPTCSRYAVEAIEEWGVFAGLVLALWRLLRCNPFSYGGYDPVPKRKGRNREACAPEEAEPI
jgi:putative membrane protein insertion efficiency factor